MTDYASARLNMVESQIRPNAVTDAGLLQAYQTIPREAFVPEALRSLAYMEDEIAFARASGAQKARKLMAPMPQARLIQLAEIEKKDLVLDIGCATGYSTAILASVAGAVVGVECDAGLAEIASQTLTELEIDNAAVVAGPLEEGYAPEGPYDAIVLNGCVPRVPDALLAQLKDGGRLVAVIAEHGFGEAVTFMKSGSQISHRPAFDAGAPLLPGFEQEKSFVF